MKKLNLKSLTVQSFVIGTKSVVGGRKHTEHCLGSDLCYSGHGYQMCGSDKANL